MKLLEDGKEQRVFSMSGRELRPIRGDLDLPQELPEDWAERFYSLGVGAERTYEVYHYYATHRGLQPTTRAIKRDALHCNSTTLARWEAELVDAGLISVVPKRLSGRVQVHSTASVLSKTWSEGVQSGDNRGTIGGQFQLVLASSSTREYVSLLRKDKGADNFADPTSSPSSEGAPRPYVSDTETEIDRSDLASPRTKRERPEKPRPASLKAITASGPVPPRRPSPKAEALARAAEEAKRADKDRRLGKLRVGESRAALAYFCFVHERHYGLPFTNYDYAQVCGLFGQQIRKHGSPAVRAFIDTGFKYIRDIDISTAQAKAMTPTILLSFIPWMLQECQEYFLERYAQHRFPERWKRRLPLPEQFRTRYDHNTLNAVTYYGDDPQGARYEQIWYNRRPHWRPDDSGTGVPTPVRELPADAE